MKNEIFIAKTFAGIEPVLFKELENMGAVNCQIMSRAVRFEGSMELLYKANYYCRTALRILWQVSTFSFQNNNQFYEAIYNFPTEKYLSKDGTLAISATMSNSIFKTPLFASVLAKDAICDRFRSLFDERPSVEKDNPDVQLHLHIYEENAALFLDASGESLHKRGYKVSNHPAPINEVVASAMIQLSEWNGSCDFIDCMCGGGTLLIEAAMIALNIPAGFYRSHFGFFNWKTFDKNLWNQIVNEADIKSDVSINFYGSDISSRYLGMARVNVESADLQDFIELKKMDMLQSHPVKTPAIVMINPPYGERLEVDDIDFLYKQIGDTWKNNYSNCTAFVISSDKEALKNIGLRPSRKFTLYNGALECKFLKFELYSGKKYASNPEGTQIG
ncbi:MAG: class I SAM-dependent RNA methyltransferase [Bacteroidales bacterium]